jgi:hypothetical protein
MRMVVMEASVAQRKANLFRCGVPGTTAAEGSNGAAVTPPCAMTLLSLLADRC